MLEHVLDLHAPGGRAALLRSRPGGGGPDPDDLGWAQALTTACRAAGVPVATMHMATDVDLRPIVADDLPAPRRREPPGAAAAG